MLEEEGPLTGVSYTGREFEQLPDKQKEALLAAKKSMVFSRAEPKHKQVNSCAEPWQRDRAVTPGSLPGWLPRLPAREGSGATCSSGAQGITPCWAGLFLGRALACS